LNRPTLNESYRFGDPNYAKEELRAELTSVFLGVCRSELFARIAERRQVRFLTMQLRADRQFV